MISYIPSSTETIELVVYDVFGRRVAGTTCKPGNGVRQLLPGELPSGVYVCRLTSGSYIDSKRFVVID
ncbi:MAG: T9SS type A sorting domain-containing protein [Candidatus Sabulitectum sp.]|nr:T9SS type A sorting domain-containing protein [Candidatus Sabulitectum sp.]